VTTLFLHWFTINVSEGCWIDAQAYAGNNFAEAKYSYLKLNGVTVWQASWIGDYPNDRGANMFIIDRATCTVLETRNYNTYGDATAGNRLRGFIQGLSDGTILVGVSCDEASIYLDAADATLTALGADVSDVGYRGAWTFLAEIGRPSKTVLDKELIEEAARARQPILSTSLWGM